MTDKYKHRLIESQRQYELQLAWKSFLTILPDFRQAVNHYHQKSQKMTELDYISSLIQIRQRLISQWEPSIDKHSRVRDSLTRLLDNLIKIDNPAHKKIASVDEVYSLCLRKIK